MMMAVTMMTMMRGMGGERMRQWKTMMVVQQFLVLGIGKV
jgi:hypothetical protein